MGREQKRDLAVILTALIMSAVLMFWLTVTAPSSAEMIVLDYARQEGISPREYPVSLIALLDRNPETREFVLEYPFRTELVTDLSSYDRSLGVPLLMQWDQRWGYMDYGSDMVAITGDAPLCLAMAGYYVTGDARFHPDSVVRFAADNGYGEDSGLDLIRRGGEALGLRVKELAREESKVAAYLKSGCPVIALMGPGDFTAGGHFIVLTAYADGKLSVNDPDSYVNSGTQWEFDDIKRQARSFWLIQPETAQ